MHFVQRNFGMLRANFELMPGREKTADATARDNRFLSRQCTTDTARVLFGEICRNGWRVGNVHRRFRRRAQSGVLETAFVYFARDAGKEYLKLTAPSSAGICTPPGRLKKDQDQTIKRSKGGLSIKIRATVDPLGNSTGFRPTGGHACDLDEADALLPVISQKPSSRTKAMTPTYGS